MPMVIHPFHALEPYELRHKLFSQRLMEETIRLERVERLRQALRKGLDPTGMQFRFAEVVMIEVMRRTGIKLPVDTVESRGDDCGGGQVGIGTRINQSHFQSAVGYADHTATVVIAIRYIGRGPGF